MRGGIFWGLLAEVFNSVESRYSDESAFLFSTLQKLEQRGLDYNIFDVEHSDDEMLCLPASSYHFISHIFFDTMLVDRVAVVLHLRDLPLLREGKGLTHAFVNFVLNSLDEETPGTIPYTQPQERASASRSTGSKKDSERIKATRRICEEVIKNLYSEKLLFEGNKSNWKQRLIFDNGKTNWKTFLGAVATRLGSNPHHKAAREVWKQVSDNLKHNGRMREQ